MTDNTKMREAFVQACKEYGPTISFGDFECGWDACMAWQAAQSAAVPVVGEAVAWGVTKRYEDNVWFISDSRFTAQYYAQMYAHRIGENPDQVVIPLYRKPATSISADELDVLRKDAERLQYMLDEAAIIMCAVGTTSTMYRLEWPLTGYVQTDFHKSEREAIDAAIAGEK